MHIKEHKGDKIILYSSDESQWANVPLLGLAEKGYPKSDYEIKKLGLVAADNFDPEYLEINPNGTVPSLTAPQLDKPLIDSEEILEFLDSARPEGTKLTPDDAHTRDVVQRLIDLVHSDDVGTNLILLQARSKDEMEAKKSSLWKEFLGNRQKRLEEHHSALPDHPFYAPKASQNGTVYKLYTTDIGPGHEAFFETTHHQYRNFAAGLDRLEVLLVLPYAAGDNVTLADFHIVPWLSHAMWGAGGVEVQDFEPLEKLIQKTVPEFKVGPRTREWWSNIAKRDSFKEVFPKLH